jgi:hypothetical protein
MVPVQENERLFVDDNKEGIDEFAVRYLLMF